jgi:biopolymer transport protein ExbD
MTPMIDIVFQLLIFFILTLRIAPAEAEFELKMPRRGTTASAEWTAMPMIVELTSHESGSLESIVLNGEALSGIEELQARIVRLVAENPQLTTAARVELRCEEELAYEHAIAALGAVSTDRLADGTLVRLIERVRLTAP